jgi:hypothetical protein
MGPGLGPFILAENAAQFSDDDHASTPLGFCPKSDVRSVDVVVDPPRLDFAPRIRDRQELMRVQALVTQFAVIDSMNPCSTGLSGVDEIRLYTLSISPLIQRPAGEFHSVVHRDGSGLAMAPETQPKECPDAGPRLRRRSR